MDISRQNQSPMHSEEGSDANAQTLASQTGAQDAKSSSEASVIDDVDSDKDEGKGMGEGNHPNHSWVVTESDEKLYGKASGHGAPADALLSKSSTKDFILGISSEQSGWFVSDVYMRQFTLEEDLCETAREFGADELILSSRIGTEAYIDAKLVEAVKKEYPGCTEISKRHFWYEMRKNGHAPMPSSVYGYLVNNIMLVADESLFTIVWKFFQSMLLVAPVWAIQELLLRYLTLSSANSDALTVCRSDYLELRLLILVALLLNVSLSLRDWFVEVFTLVLCDGVLIDADDDIKIKKEIKPLGDRIVATIASYLIIVFMELRILQIVVAHAVRSILSAEDADEIVSDGLAILFINEIDNIAYSVLIPERDKTMQAKQLFSLSGFPSDEILSFIKLSKASSRKEIFTRFMGTNLFIFLLSSVYLMQELGPVFDFCAKEFQQFLLVVGIRNSFFAELLIKTVSSVGNCPTPVISNNGDYSNHPNYMVLDRDCAPSYWFLKNNITAVILTGIDANNQFTFFPITFGFRFFQYVVSTLYFVFLILVW